MIITLTIGKGAVNMDKTILGENRNRILSKGLETRRGSSRHEGILTRIL
jgi:hypothetical protein